MNLFPHNNITINDVLYSRDSLLKTCRLKAHDSSDELYDFWFFVANWLDKSKHSIAVKTSGSTGEPKIILHHKSRMMASAQMTCDYFEIDNSKSILICLSTKHIAGMMMVVRAFFSGADIILQEASSNPLQQLSKRIDFTAMVPYQVTSCFENSPEKWNLINTIIIGGGIVSYRLRNNIRQLNLNAFQTFGMTETISHIAIRNILTEDSYMTLDGVTVCQDKRDCLQIDAPMLCDRVLVTNDIVNLKSSTSFEWLGRIDNAIETGGYKVIPEYIERKISHLLTDRRFFISSLKDERFNNRIVLVIEGTKYALSLSLLDSILKKQELPKEVIFIPQFIETPTGKIKRSTTLSLAK